MLVLPLIPALSGGNGVRESGGLFLDCRGDVDEQGQNHKAKYHTNADEDLVDPIVLLREARALGVESGISTCPKRRIWPGLSTFSVTFSPLIKVPLVEFRSRTTTSLPRSKTSQ